MFSKPTTFRIEYRGSDLVYGRDCVARLGEYLAEHGLNRALIVCGKHVGSNTELMGRIESGIGDRLAIVFDKTTPEKRAETVFNAIDVLQDHSIDVVVGLGGGSSLDIAKQVSAFANTDLSIDTLREAAHEGDPKLPSLPESLPPVIVVPTTFAGADLSGGGSVNVLSPAESPSDQPKSVGRTIYPMADFADPALFETTPTDVLAGSAMNGFNKCLETLYACGSNPVGVVTAFHGLGLLRDTLPHVATDSHPYAAELVDSAVLGIVLAQYEGRLSLIHAFGHGFSRRHDVQQGIVHAIVTPHVLRYLFENIDANRFAIANAFGGIPMYLSDAAVAELVIGETEQLRDALGLPDRLRDLPEHSEFDLPTIAKFIVNDPLLEHVPEPLVLTSTDVEAVLQEAW